MYLFDLKKKKSLTQSIFFVIYKEQKYAKIFSLSVF